MLWHSLWWWWRRWRRRRLAVQRPAHTGAASAPSRVAGAPSGVVVRRAIHAPLLMRSAAPAQSRRAFAPGSRRSDRHSRRGGRDLSCRCSERQLQPFPTRAFARLLPRVLGWPEVWEVERRQGSRRDVWWRRRTTVSPQVVAPGRGPVHHGRRRVARSCWRRHARRRLEQQRLGGRAAAAERRRLAARRRSAARGSQLPDLLKASLRIGRESVVRPRRRQQRWAVPGRLGQQVARHGASRTLLVLSAGHGHR